MPRTYRWVGVDPIKQHNSTKITLVEQDLLDDGEVRLFDCRSEFDREVDGFIPGSIFVNVENLLSDDIDKSEAPRFSNNLLPSLVY